MDIDIAFYLLLAISCNHVAIAKKFTYVRNRFQAIDGDDDLFIYCAREINWIQINANINYSLIILKRILLACIYEAAAYSSCQEFTFNFERSILRSSCELLYARTDNPGNDNFYFKLLYWVINMGDVSDGHGGRIHQDIAMMEGRYQGRFNENMMGWLLLVFATWWSYIYLHCTNSRKRV